MDIAAPFTVLNVVLELGERLPCLVESATRLPARAATRWAVRCRRHRVQSSTLANNLRVPAPVYRRARETVSGELDNRLTCGEALRNREIGRRTPPRFSLSKEHFRKSSTTERC